MIRDLNERRHDARYEPKESDGEEEARPEEAAAVGDGDADGIMRDVRDVRDGVPTLPSDDSGEHPASVRDTEVTDSQAVTAAATPGKADDPLPSVVSAAASPEPDVEPLGTSLSDLLREAGARVRPDQIADWSVADNDEASTWALAQIEAHQHARPGTTTSVRWPDHVSRAHHATVEAAHAPAPHKAKMRTGRR